MKGKNVNCVQNMFRGDEGAQMIAAAVGRVDYSTVFYLLLNCCLFN